LGFHYLVKIRARKRFLNFAPIEGADEKDYDDRSEPEDRTRVGSGSFFVSFPDGHIDS
jgi:hypothetical protein